MPEPRPCSVGAESEQSRRRPALPQDSKDPRTSARAFLKPLEHSFLYLTQCPDLEAIDFGDLTLVSAGVNKTSSKGNWRMGRQRARDTSAGE